MSKFGFKLFIKRIEFYNFNIADLLLLLNGYPSKNVIYKILLTHENIQDIYCNPKNTFYIMLHENYLSAYTDYKKLWYNGILSHNYEKEHCRLILILKYYDSNFDHNICEKKSNTSLKKLIKYRIKKWGSPESDKKWVSRSSAYLY